MHTSSRAITRTALFAALMCCAAFVRIPLGPVPLTFQSPMALIAGYCLGARHGAIAMILYMVVGLTGIPVFSSGGGPAYVLSPTFGYIIGFILCAAIIGALAPLNRRQTSIPAYIFMLTALAGLYLPGVAWLVVAMRWIAETPPEIMTVLKAGLFVPLIGDVLTTVPAAFVAVRIRKSMSRTG